jgi:hypothetical protein
MKNCEEYRGAQFHVTVPKYDRTDAKEGRPLDMAASGLMIES